VELRHLRYFNAVARELNFSRAAQLLHVAQPPLSRQIRQLEEELGTELFDRSTRPLQLTDAGRFFYEQTGQLLSRIEDIRQATARIGRGEKAWFGIGFVPSTLYGVLPGLIRRFREESAQTEVSLSELMTIEQASALRSGRIDVGFGRLDIADPEIICRTLVEEPLLAVMSAEHPLLQHDSVSLAQLAQESVILYPARPRPSYADFVLKTFRTRGLEPAHLREANEMQTAIGLVAAAVGVAVVPESIQRLHRQDVDYRPISDPGVFSPVIMNYRANDDSRELKQFLMLVDEAQADSQQ